MLGWVLFRSTSLTEAWQLFGVMGGWRSGQGGNLALVTTPLSYALLLLALGIAWFAPDTWRLELPRRPAWGFALALLLVVCLLRFATPSPFLYFQF